jgi:hypothetical protein
MRRPAKMYLLRLPFSTELFQCAEDSIYVHMEVNFHDAYILHTVIMTGRLPPSVGLRTFQNIPVFGLGEARGL